MLFNTMANPFRLLTLMGVNHRFQAKSLTEIVHALYFDNMFARKVTPRRVNHRFQAKSETVIVLCTLRARYTKKLRLLCM